MKEKEIKFSSYTDESGQDTKGKIFFVCTLIIDNKKFVELDTCLKAIEVESKKEKKWHGAGNQKRHLYIKLLLEKRIFDNVTCYYGCFENKKDYIDLVSSSITKSILTYAGSTKYEAKIFIDKMDKRTITSIKKELKQYHIRYKKITGLSDESSSFIRLADAICGVLRDLKNKNVPKVYLLLQKKLKEV